MPKILITGNGFDLSFGLPTTYIEFINILNTVDKITNPSFEDIYSNCLFPDLFNKNFKEFEFNKEAIEELKTAIQSNLWYNFFKTELKIETWIDFENKIEYVLHILLNSSKLIHKNIFSKGSLVKDENFFYEDVFENNIETIKVLESFNIISSYSDEEISLNSNFLTLKHDYFINLNLGSITKSLNTELIEFKRIFNLYFETFILPLYEEFIPTRYNNPFVNFDEHYTFNYTPTFDKFYKLNKPTQHLHGRISSEKNSIVLGINEIPDDNLNRKFYLPFTKYFQKLDINTDYKFLTEYKNHLRYGFQFVFYGHSLDRSDAEYINEVFDLIHNVQNSHKNIIIIYHNDKSKSQLLINLLSIRGKEDILKLMKDDILLFVKSNSNLFNQILMNDISYSVRAYTIR